MRRARAFILPAMLAAAVPAFAQAWLTYANDRFGATIDYPPVFSVRAEPPANGDGQRFLTADRTASLAAFGVYNVSHAPPRQKHESRREADGEKHPARANPAVRRPHRALAIPLGM